MTRKNWKWHRGSIALSLALLGMCLTLAFLIPYVHDDWDWGSAGGLERLSTLFAGYNGRYLGNLLSLAATRSVLFKTLAMGLTLFATLMLLGREAHAQGLCLTALGTALFFTMSQPMAEQSIGWLSAFFNYGVGALGLLVLLRRAFFCFEEKTDGEKKRAGPAACACHGLAGLAGALLMENVTIALVVLSLALAVYTLCRDGRPDGAGLSFFAGSALGAWVMFSNGAYGLIAGNRDFYRTMSFQYWNSWDVVFAQARWFFRDYHLRCLFADELPLLFTLCVCALASIRRLREKTGPARRRVLEALAAVLLLYPLFLLLRQRHPEWDPFLRYTETIEELAGLAYIAAVAALPFALPVERSRRLRMSALVLAIGVLGGPLLFVTPIGDRCFYPLFVLEIAYVLELARICGAARYCRTMRVPFLGALTALCLCWLSIYARNAKVSGLRARAAVEAAEQGMRSIRVAELPYADYDWDSTPYAINVEWFKRFYGLPETVTIEAIPYEDWYREQKTAQHKSEKSD